MSREKLEKLYEVIKLIDSGNGIGSIDINTDELLEVLANKRRRMIIKEISKLDNITNIKLGKLAKKIAIKETGKSEEEIFEKEKLSAKNALYQTHLPKLDGLSIIDWNKRQNVIAKTEKTDKIASFVEKVEEISK